MAQPITQVETVQVPVIGGDVEHVSLSEESVFLTGEQPVNVVMKRLTVMAVKVPRKGIELEAESVHVVGKITRRGLAIFKLHVIGKSPANPPVP